MIRLLNINPNALFKHMIEEILSIILIDKNIIIISTNTKMSIKILVSNNRIIIKESFAVFIDFVSLSLDIESSVMVNKWDRRSRILDPGSE